VDKVIAFKGYLKMAKENNASYVWVKIININKKNIHMKDNLTKIVILRCKMNKYH
jgi:hypothetical protein